jgi:3-(3-hydroxy-phenyl)propionate hydroxylase
VGRAALRAQCDLTRRPHRPDCPKTVFGWTEQECVSDAYWCFGSDRDDGAAGANTAAVVSQFARALRPRGLPGCAAAMTTLRETHPDDSSAQGWADDDHVFDLAIVGYGPAGVAAANLAGQYGLDTVVVERDADVFPRQRAISLDAESLRIIRNLGLYAEATSTMHQGTTLQFAGLNGKPFLNVLPVPTEHCGESQANFFHQPWLEAVLREGVLRWPTVLVKCGWEYSDVSQTDDMVTLRVAEVATGEVKTIRAKYLLACDGGSSAVRKQLGVSFAGDSYSEQWMDVQAKVLRPFQASPHFQFVCVPERPGVKCPCPAGYYRWEWRINPGENAEEMLDPDRIWQILAQDGVTPQDVEIARTWCYTFHVRKCKQWRVDRIMMVGDAAHVMPPFAGQGCSGAFRDAANLMWKIEAVLRGRADDRLLDSYQAEREPHHDAMSAAAVRIGRLVMPPNRIVAQMRDTTLRLVQKIPGVEKALSVAVLRPAPLEHGYLAFPTRRAKRRAKKSLVGHLIKAVKVAQPGVHLMPVDEALGTGWAILGLNDDPRTALPADLQAAWTPFQPRYFTVRPGTSVVPEGEIGDPTGQLWEWMQKGDAKFVIVRPDRYVYATAASAAELAPPAHQIVATAHRLH